MTTWVDQAARTAGHEVALGEMLARQHTVPWSEWGGGSSWIGECAVDPAPAPDVASFYGARLLGLAGRAGWLDAVSMAMLGRPPGRGDPTRGAGAGPWLLVAGERSLGRRLADRGSSIHRPTAGTRKKIWPTPSLFGPIPERTMRAYGEVRALLPGWMERVELFQLYPLLVHALLFGAVATGPGRSPFSSGST